MKIITNIRLTPEEVVDMLIEKVSPVGRGWVDIHEAADYVCSQTLVSPMDIPHFNRSKVDGYALSGQDLLRDGPLLLKKTHIVPAGSMEEYIIEPGTTIKLMTGAPIPIGTGAVIKQEDVQDFPKEIKIDSIPIYNTNVELAGSTLKKEQILAYQGERYTTQLIEHIATTGVNKVPIYNKPSVYIINSGSELELPGKVLEYGKIFNSNQSMFLSLLKLAGCHGIAGHGKLADDLDLIDIEIKKGLKLSDLIIITGGNSEGDYDLIPQALEKIGANIIVNNIAMKPGHRTVVASYDNKLIFNVPGNPRAGYILFQVLIKPILNRMSGDTHPTNKWFDVKLTNSIKTIPNSRIFCRGALVLKKGDIGAMALSKNTFHNGLAPMILDIAPNRGKEGDLIKGMLVV